MKLRIFTSFIKVRTKNIISKNISCFYRFTGNLRLQRHIGSKETAGDLYGVRAPYHQ